MRKKRLQVWVFLDMSIKQENFGYSVVKNDMVFKIQKKLNSSMATTTFIYGWTYPKVVSHYFACVMTSVQWVYYFSLRANVQSYYLDVNFKILLQFVIFINLLHFPIV